MIVLEMMVDLSPLYISLKTAIITIIITFFFGLFLAKWTLNRKHDLTKIILDGIFTISCFTSNCYGIFLTNDLWG